MVIFVVAIPKTIPCRRLPLKAAPAGTPTLRDVSAVGFGDTLTAMVLQEMTPLRVEGHMAAEHSPIILHGVAGGEPAMNAQAAGKRAATRGRDSKSSRGTAASLSPPARCETPVQSSSDRSRATATRAIPEDRERPARRHARRRRSGSGNRTPSA